MNLEELFELLNQQSIQEFLDTNREEDLHLEFKSVSDHPFNKDDKRNFAKALSGFANSDGGIIIWGIDARKNLDGLDCAGDKRPVKMLSKFISYLNSFTGEFVTPIVDGVRHKAFPIDKDIGFAASLIPPSQSGPHMVKAGEDRYYKRSGDSFYRLEHFDLEEMFGRRPRPRLEFVANPTREGGAGLTVVLGLRNTGRGIAKFPYLAVDIEPPYKISEWGLDGNGRTGLPNLIRHSKTWRKESFGGSASIVIYPDSDLDVTAIRIDTIRHKFDKDLTMPDLVVRYSLCCEGTQMQQGEYNLPGSFIKDRVFPDQH